MAVHCMTSVLLFKYDAGSVGKEVGFYDAGDVGLPGNTGSMSLN